MTMPKKPKNGRPFKITPLIIQKLEEAASVKASVAAMAFHADISIQTYYNWIKKDRKLFERLEACRQKPGLNARLAIQQSIAAGDGNLALKYLERTEKAEFSPQTNLQHNGTLTIKDIITDDGAPI